jgi:predicted unusual protein kinase regulating ubiquinone biosynthesis (AarF/ABC1/UbiB family)
VRSKEGYSKLGLIDYGQVMFLSKSDRLLFAALIVALADDNREKIVQLMKEAGFRSKRMDEDVIYRYAKVYYDEDNPEITGGDHIQVFVEKLQAIDPIINIPDQFIMIGRTSIMLRGLGHALHQHRSIAKSWKPLAQEVLAQEGVQV